MKIIQPQEKKWQNKQGYSKKLFLDEKDLNYPGALFQEIKIKPGETAEAHHHKTQTEIFYFLTKQGYWIINGEKKEFEVGDVLVIEPGDVHSTKNDTSEDYVYLAFKFKYDPQDLYWER
jgi:quercetin dioxygenase-like cupin family protein